ncbi:MAG: replicative DNA helicase [Candidatus Solibacter usitatus]|nr:replicative DNA helicase [Candidatus Solibacter usitatus]
MSQPAQELSFDRGLPSNVYAERMVLGSILLNDNAFVTAAAGLAPEDFSLDKHRRIFQRMLDIHNREERIDRVTLANELLRHGEMEAVDGLTYLSSLDEGLPELYNLESYVQIVRDKSLMRRLIFTAQETIHKAMLGEDEPDRILAQTEDALLKLGEARAKDSLMSAQQVFDLEDGGVNAFLDPARRVHGIGTGFIKLDEMTGGLRGGELVIIAGRPAMGKTALALNIALHVATNKKNPKAVAVFSLEMSKQSLLTRLICSLARVDQQRFRSGYLDREERARLGMAAADIYDAPIYIDDTSSTTMMDINAKLRKLRAQTNLGLVVVDYLQLMPTPNLGRNSNRVQEVGALSRGMKLLSKDLDVPFMVLSQLSRAPEQRIGDHRPQLADLRESGSIEQDADLVAFIFRPEVYQKDREDLRGVAELLLAKQRNGPTGKIPLVFLHNYTKFENPADAFEEEPPG